MARRRIKATSQSTAGMRIPVFVSCPTDLNPDQDAVRKAILKILKDEMLEARALGRTDYPLTLPLAEVCVIAAHCAGGLILGFEQFRATAGTYKFLAQDTEGKSVSRTVKKLAQFPTPWNHMEASIMFSLGKPLMIMREQGISGAYSTRAWQAHSLTNCPRTWLPSPRKGIKSDRSLKRGVAKSTPRTRMFGPSRIATETGFCGRSVSKSCIPKTCPTCRSSLGRPSGRAGAPGSCRSRWRS